MSLPVQHKTSHALKSPSSSFSFLEVPQLLHSCFQPLICSRESPRQAGDLVVDWDMGGKKGNPGPDERQENDSEVF